MSNGYTMALEYNRIIMAPALNRTRYANKTQIKYYKNRANILLAIAIEAAIKQRRYVYNKIFGAFNNPLFSKILYN